MILYIKEIIYNLSFISWYLVQIRIVSAVSVISIDSFFFRVDDHRHIESGYFIKKKLRKAIILVNIQKKSNTSESFYKKKNKSHYRKKFNLIIFYRWKVFLFWMFNFF